MQPSNTPNAQEGAALTNDELEEARLVKGLEMLDNLHVLAIDLRSTIPRMTAPLTTARSSSELYVSLMKSVAGAQKEIQSFDQILDKAGFAKVLDRANKSRRDNPQGIIPWNPSEHPDWFEKGCVLNLPS